MVFRICNWSSSFECVIFDISSIYQYMHCCCTQREASNYLVALYICLSGFSFSFSFLLFNIGFEQTYTELFSGHFLERSKPFTLIILAQKLTNQCNQTVLCPHSTKTIPPSPPLFFMDRNEQKVFYFALGISINL